MKTEKLNFEITVSLGQTRLSKEEAATLQVGDILVLNQKVEEKCPLYVGNTCCFLASLGLCTVKKAVRIDARICAKTN